MLVSAGNPPDRWSSGDRRKPKEQMNFRRNRIQEWFRLEGILMIYGSNPPLTWKGLLSTKQDSPIGSIFGMVTALCGAEWQGSAWKAKDPAWIYGNPLSCLYKWLTWNHRALWFCAHREQSHPLGWFFGAAAGQSEAAPGVLERWSFSLKCLCTLWLLVRQQTWPTIKIKLLL